MCFTFYYLYLYTKQVIYHFEILITIVLNWIYQQKPKVYSNTFKIDTIGKITIILKTTE